MAPLFKILAAHQCLCNPLVRVCYRCPSVPDLQRIGVCCSDARFLAQAKVAYALAPEIPGSIAGVSTKMAAVTPTHVSSDAWLTFSIPC